MRHADPGHYQPPYAAEAPPPANRRPGGAELEAALRRYREATRGAHGFTAVIAATRRLAARAQPAALRASNCKSRFCSSVETRA